MQNILLPKADNFIVSPLLASIVDPGCHWQYESWQ